MSELLNYPNGENKIYRASIDRENTLESISLSLRSDPSFRRFEAWRLPVIASIQTRSRYLTFERVRGLTKFAGFQSNTLRNAGYQQLSPVDPLPSNAFIFLQHRSYFRYQGLFDLSFLSLFFKSLLYRRHCSRARY